MNLAFLISFMTFHFFLNLDFSANICPIRTLILISFIFFKKIPKSVPGSQHRRNFFKTKPRNLLNFKLFLHFSPQEFVIFFKYMIEKYFGNKL